MSLALLSTLAALSLAAPAPAASELACRTSLPRESHWQRDMYRFFSYDDAGRLVLAFTDVAGLPVDLDVFRYAPDGREAWRTRYRPFGGSELVHTVRDAKGRLVREEQLLQGEATVRNLVERDAADRVVRRIYFGTETHVSYRPDGRVESEGDVRWEWSPSDPRRATRVSPKGVLDTVFVDERQRVVRRVSQFNSRSGEPELWTDYRYDDRDEVVEESQRLADGSTRVTHYLRDRFGNLLEGDAPRFDCPPSEDVVFGQQAGARDVNVEEDPRGGDLRIAGRVERGLRQGTWVVTTHAGPKLREVEYKDGLPVKAITFFAAGMPYEEGRFENGLRSGFWTRYWENSNLRETGSYVHGWREGEFKQFAEDGSSLPSLTFTHGRPDCSNAQPEGQECENDEVVRLHAGKPTGRALGFGRVDRQSRQVVDVVHEVHYLEGFKHGPETSWANDGMVARAGHFWLGAPYGPELFGLEDGTFDRYPGKEIPRKSIGVVPKPPAHTGEVGLVVTHLFPGFPADKAGLQEGDVIVRAAGADVHNIEELSAAVQAPRVTLVVKRGATTKTYELAAVGPSPLAAEAAGTEPCPAAIARNAAAFNQAGDILWAKSRTAKNPEEAMSARGQMLACYLAAHAAPAAERPIWSCNNAMAAFHELRRDAGTLGWTCLDEASDPAVAAAAWYNLGESDVPAGHLVSCLVRPTPQARMALEATPNPNPKREELRLIERSELKTGRPELPVLVAERRASADSSREWLWLWDGAEPFGERYPTVVPVAARKAGTCVARRTFEIKDGRAQIRSTTAAAESGRACEAEVAPAGDYALDLFLAVPLSQQSERRPLPPAIEREWAAHQPKEVTSERRDVMAVDLNLDGELDWLIRGTAWIDVVQSGPAPKWIGRLEGTMGPRILRARLNGYRVIEVSMGFGPRASADVQYVFNGREYREQPYRKDLGQ